MEIHLSCQTGIGRILDLPSNGRYDDVGHFQVSSAQGKCKLCQKILITFVGNATSNLILIRVQYVLRFIAQTENVHIVKRHNIAAWY